MVASYKVKNGFKELLVLWNVVVCGDFWNLKNKQQCD